jgi:muramoyltetrapeptide carboxypeptidase
LSFSLIKPRVLKPGARLAVVSPASTPRPELVEAGMKRLTELGYHPVLFPNALGGGPLYYAGTLQQRAADLMAAFEDTEIDGIICTRGGWGSAELLPFLDEAVVRANPKAFVGYSDHTSLHVWLARECGLVSFYGPMVASDFGRTDGVEAASWQHAFGGDSNWSLGPDDGIRMLRKGLAEGTISGGCLSIYTEAFGTPYAPLPARTDEPRVLFLEDIGTKPYQWDRMLLHLRYAGILENVQGIVFGDMRQCVSQREEEFLEQAILHALRDFDGPIAMGLRSGHVDSPNVTVPLGIQVRLDLTAAGNPRLDFLESAVSV